MKYINRGDPAAYDFLTPFFVMDGLWHDLDLSGIVPAAAANHLVDLRVLIADTFVGRSILIREKGNVNDINATEIWTQEAGEANDVDTEVMLDANRVLEYKMLWTVSVVQVVVRGWWTD